ncbi:MAG: glycosyltransferase [Chloroflexi bacterium]|nr:glycosyltransferase [Chloroflexota bacterium]
MFTYPTVSLCMIVKNEQENLVRCLGSVKDVVDEVIVVDTGSEDATPRIAIAHGATVIRHGWQDDFARARNVGLDRATSDWILVLDADEELEAASARAFKQAVADTNADGLTLVQRSLTPPGELQRYDDLSITRLFRNRSEYRYLQPIHEQIRPSIERHGGRVAESRLVILHHGYGQRTAQGGELRAARNLRILEKALAESPEDPYFHYQLGVTYKALGKAEAAEKHLRQAVQLGSQTLDRAIRDQLYMKLAQLALASEQYSQAVEWANQSLGLNPNNLVSEYVAGVAHMFLGNLRPAHDIFAHLRLEGADILSDPGELDTVLAYCRRTMGSVAR